MYQRLRFRRQFLLSRAPIELLDDWTSLSVGDFYLYAHPDLDVHEVENRNQRIVLLGSIFDAENPEKGNTDIIRDLLARSENLDDFLVGAEAVCWSVCTAVSLR